MKHPLFYFPKDEREIINEILLRLMILGGVAALVFLILGIRLFSIQLYHGEEHRKKIASQSIRRIRLPGWRGSIYSRDRVLLAGNRPSYDLVFYPEEMRRKNREKTIDNMTGKAEAAARILGRKNPPGRKAVARHLWISPGMPMVIFRDLSPLECARALDFSRREGGADLQTGAIRIYPGGPLAAHLIGFSRLAEEIAEEDREEFFYYRPDTVGKSGIEAALDKVSGEESLGLGLRAFPGRQTIQVNNVGFVHKELLGKVEPIHGNDVILTLDSRAQAIAEKLLGNAVGAMVVLDGDTGDILCAATAPRFDLSRFVPVLSQEYYNSLLHDPRKPLLNRAFSAIYPPGSTLKPLIALAFLNGGINPHEKIPCPGRSRVGDASIGCSAHPFGAQAIDLGEALEKSCNGYMIRHAVTCGYPLLAEIISSARIGEKTQTTLPEEAGIFPSLDKKQAFYGSPWNDYDTALLSIGQGFIAMTPLQMARCAAAFGNGGIIYEPHIVYEITDASGECIRRREVREVGRLAASPEALEVVKEGMFRVVNAPYGSGKRAHVPGLVIYGKTGTAETGPRKERRNITHFICFLEYRNRRYAAAITVEDGLSGGRSCAPVAAEFFEQYLHPEVPEKVSPADHSLSRSR